MCETRFSFPNLLVTAACRWLLFALLLSTKLVPAQQPPLRHYDVEDGLAHSNVGPMFQDRKGYMWFGTSEGLSRFDGYHFKTYGVEDGLPNQTVTAITQDPQGRMWVGTFAGIARLLDEPADQTAHQAGGARKKFLSYRIGSSADSNGVDSLLFEPNGTIWCTSDQIYRAAPAADGNLKFELGITRDPGAVDFRSFADHEGRLWFGWQHELIEYLGGEVIRYGAADGLPLGQTLNRASSNMADERVIGITQDSSGRIVAANSHNIFELIPLANNKRGRWQKLSLDLPDERLILSLAADSHGQIWLATTRGLIRYSVAGPPLFMLPELPVGNVFEDRQANLWIATGAHGVYKSSGDFIVNLTKPDGLPDQSIMSIVEDRQGRMYAGMETGGAIEITNGKVTALLESHVAPFVGSHKRMLYDSRGDYWQLTTDGLYHFKGPRLDFHTGTKITGADGVRPGDRYFGLGLYEDPTGRIWVGGEREIYTLDLNQKGPAVFKRISLDTLGLPAEKHFELLHCVISDRSGALWFGWHDDIGRYKDGKMTLLAPTDGLPLIAPRSFFLDSRGWLWISTQRRGVSVTMDPTAEHPKFLNYSTDKGLSSSTLESIAEDDLGRIYLTGKGLDRLDPFTGHVRHFTTADGMIGIVLRQVLKDHLGNIWIASSAGLSKLNPRAERDATAAPLVYFSRLQIAGDDFPLPETGAQRIGPIELPAARNNLLVEFVGLNFQGEGALRYQYKLEGVDKDWSAPGEQRSVNYARLGPGSYRLLVRAINAEGRANETPSILQFRILPPFWQRWWFIVLVTLLALTVVYKLYQYRVRRLLQLERVRTRIATDLHDEIGSNLSLIAMIGDLAKRQMQHEDSQVARWLSLIASTSRESVDAMSDIVWVVDPKKDRVTDLTMRMRRVVDDVLTARDISFNFDAPGENDDLKLGANTRREVFLIFKECINNLARHSECTRGEIEFKVEKGKLFLRVKDNGKGFDTANARAGNGLASMQRRASNLGGEFEMESSPTSGTTVTLRVPLKGKRTF